MPPLLHDPAVRDSIIARLKSLTPHATRAWGKMTIDQMLWHLCEPLEVALGRRAFEPMRIPLPRFLVKFGVINMPWPKGAQTHPSWVAGGRYSFDDERARCLRLIDEFTSRDINAAWPPSAFGAASGREWSQLQAKHLDHHLKQFGA